MFLRDPTPAFDICGDAAFCATGDTGISGFYYSKDRNHRPRNERNYFNGGLLLLRPNATLFHELLARRAACEGTFFGDQDCLNDWFRGRWEPLPFEFNLMHAATRDGGFVPDNAVALHEKAGHAAHPLCLR